MRTRSRSSRAASRCWRSTGRGKAKRSTKFRSAATTNALRARSWTGYKVEQDLDKDKIAIWGVSLGGYYAPRAAAYEKRLKACIALSGPFDWAQIWDALPDLTRETFQARSHSKTAADAKASAAKLTLREAAQKHHLPAVRRRRPAGPPGAGVARRDAREGACRARWSCSWSRTAATMPTTGRIATEAGPPTGSPASSDYRRSNGGCP